MCIRDRAKTISEKAKETIAEYTRRLARALHVIGMINIQFIVLGDDVYVIEVNPRSSRTVPYISKVTGIPIVPLATKVLLGYKLKDMGYEPGLQPEAKHYAIKMPVFSFEKIRGADISLGPVSYTHLGLVKTFSKTTKELGKTTRELGARAEQTLSLIHISSMQDV